MRTSGDSLTSWPAAIKYLEKSSLDHFEGKQVLWEGSLEDSREG